MKTKRYYLSNCRVRPAVTNLKCFKLVFLPPNVTFALQPMDQGVIRCLKSHYRRVKEQVLKLIENLDSNDQKSFTVFDAILMISGSMGKGITKTIANCFRHAGFKHLLTISSDDVTDDDEEDNISLAQLAQILQPDLSTIEADELVDVDISIAICAPAAEEDIVQEVQDHEQKDTEEQFTLPSLNSGLNVVSVLQKIVLYNEQFQMQGNSDDRLIKIPKNTTQKCSKQTKITDLIKIEK